MRHEPLRRFFPFFGGKGALARRYGPPQRDLVIEPFAGSAGYSTFWQPRKVLLVEKDPVLFGVWDWLIHVSAAEVVNIPVDIQHVDEANVCQEAKWFLGYWFNTGVALPVKRRATGCFSTVPHNTWHVETRARIANQVEHIRHWQIKHGSYEEAPDREAHWYIDPPYRDAGKAYRFGSEQIDYDALVDWCLSRQGFEQVCEADGADWLPFRFFAPIGGAKKGKNRVRRYTYEALYEQGQRRHQVVDWRAPAQGIRLSKTRQMG